MSFECKQLATEAVCYTDALLVKTSLVAHYEYGTNALGNTIITATRYTDAAGVPVDTSLGTVVVGLCAVNVVPADVELETLCDTLAGVVTEFVRRTTVTFNPDGTVLAVVVADFALDNVTPYVVAGVVSDCSMQCAPATPLGLLATWG